MPDTNIRILGRDNPVYTAHVSVATNPDLNGGIVIVDGVDPYYPKEGTFNGTVTVMRKCGLAKDQAYIEVVEAVEWLRSLNPKQMTRLHQAALDERLRYERMRASNVAAKFVSRDMLEATDDK